MKISDILLMCIRNLTRSKGRTFLTVVGVIAGTCSIVIMISIGVGLKASNDAMLAAMGDLTLIEVYNFGAVDPATNKPLVLDDKVLDDFKNLPNVATATPFYNPPFAYNFKAGSNGRYQTYSSLIGITPGAMESLGYELHEGSYDLTTTKKKTLTVIVGQDASYEFFDTKRRGSGRWRYPEDVDANGNPIPPFVDLMKDKVTLEIPSNDSSREPLVYELVVVGRLKFTDGAWQTRSDIFADLATIKEIEEAYKKLNKIKDSDDNGRSGYQEVKVKVTDIKYVEEVENYISGLGYSTYSMEGTRKPLEDQAKQQQLVLGCLGATSLVVAAIGIANTMFMSILERTREIGIMKVVGCYVRDIRTAFLIEASAIGLIGGVAGVGLSFFVSWLMNTFGFSFTGGTDMYFIEQPTATDVSIIPWWLVLGALVFSTIIGLISGYFPANRAVQIEALEAIKHD